MSLWKGRFSGETSDAMSKVNNSLTVDIRLLPYDIKTNEAWAEELMHVGILSAEEFERTKKALTNIARECRDGAYETLPDDEDVHTLVERRLTELLGDTGKKIHSGRSRNDQVVTDFLLFLKDDSAALKKHLTELINVLLGLAESHVHTIMPGYTHLQQAQPILLGHYFLSFAFALNDDLCRLNSYIKNNLGLCPLGSGALAGTTLNINRDRLAKNLGFNAPTVNSIHSISDRAFAIELASILAIIAMHQSRYAEDFIIWNSREFDFIKLSDRVSTGSSMMPQKKNPDSLELIRAMTGRIYGNLMGLLTISKGVPLTYAKDLQEDKEFVFDSIDTTKNTLVLFTEVLGEAIFNVGKMQTSLSDETLATDIADYCVGKGMPFRKAHETVGNAIKLSQKEGKPFKEILLREIRQLDIDETSISPASSLTRRSSLGGTSPSSITQQIKYLRGLLG